MRTHSFLNAAYFAVCSAEVLQITGRAAWDIGQTVQTTSGPVSGHAASNATEVSEYLGIPFAQPPVGDLRFAPPQKYSGTSPINGTNYSPSCPAEITMNFNASIFAATNTSAAGALFLDAFAQVGDTFSEDCLTVNVWTKPQTGEAKKAVLVWIYGGGFALGNSDNPGYNGQYIADQEDVVLVSFNYRLNIFGFPGSPSTANNLGLLDQRLALEWVRDNIEAFGGDPSRITLFGQSAGGASVDYFTFAWTDDPIVSGFIPESGTAGAFSQLTANSSAELWYTVTSAVGCGNSTTSSSDAVLACMRNITDFNTILWAIPNSTTGAVFASGSFGPTVDETVVFSDYVSRALAGSFVQAPVLIGNANYEGGLFQLIAEIAGAALPQSFWNGTFQNLFNCGAALRANISVYNNLPIWRYRYFGEFPNLNLSTTQDLGAYHASELPIIFGIPPFGEGIPENTPAEIDLMKYIRGAWATFAKDPINGLKGGNYSWPTYQPGGQTLVRLGYNDTTGSNLALGQLYDSACTSLFPIGGGNGTVPRNSTTTSTVPGSSIPVATSTAAVTTTPNPSSTSVTSGSERSLGSISLVRLLVLGLLLRGF